MGYGKRHYLWRAVGRYDKHGVGRLKGREDWEEALARWLKVSASTT
jgi:hypothetical protein